MRRSNRWGIAIALVMAGSVAVERTKAAAFVNLDFESATLVPYYPGFPSLLEWNFALPGWQPNNPSPTLPAVYYGTNHVGISGWYRLFDAGERPNRVLAGKYSVGFENGFVNTIFQQNGLVQTGDIAPDAKSIRMLAQGPLGVFVDGNAIPMQSLGGNAYGGDISMYAGTTAQLKILNASPSFVDNLLIDNITFSPVAVPEPLSLAALGMVSNLANRRRPRR